MKKRKLYVHDYTDVSKAESMLCEVITRVSMGKKDDSYDDLTSIRDLLRHYLTGDNLKEDEDGSLMLYSDECDPTLPEVFDMLNGMAERSGGRCTVRFESKEGFVMKVSSEKLTEEELKERRIREEEGQEYD